MNAFQDQLSTLGLSGVRAVPFQTAPFYVKVYLYVKAVTSSLLRVEAP